MSDGIHVKVRAEPHEGGRIVIIRAGERIFGVETIRPGDPEQRERNYEISVYELPEEPSTL